MGGTDYQATSGCTGIQCTPSEYEEQGYESLTKNGANPLPEPEALIRVGARSPEPYSTSSEYGEGEHSIKVDAKPPYGITVSGLATKGEELELGEVEAHVKVEAKDGEGIASSGVLSIRLGIDGKEVGERGGNCKPGPCTASNEWSINGAEIGSGEHKLEVIATDYANNETPKKIYRLNVYHATPVAMGPGSVNPESGDFALEASDAPVSGGGMGALSIVRHYDSLNPKEGEEGPLGPQWKLSLGSVASLEVLPDNSVMVVGSSGLTHFPSNEHGGFNAPEGDKNLTLEYEPKTPAYILRNPVEGTTTEFTLPSGAKSWMPTVSKGAVKTDTTTDEYTTAEVEGKTIVEPTFELAPHPEATCSKEKMEAGCRALEFVYGKETKAKGESKAEWGEYKGHLKEVIAVAYSESSKAMTKTTVAAYEYDAHGRLRAEWNPQGEKGGDCAKEECKALKTTYGYDSEGHITSLTPPGQESWAFTYGTIAGDASTGRLLKLTRAPAGAALWNGEAPKNTTAPKLSGTPVVGKRLTVSEGAWSNSPVVYGFQWEDCNYAGAECKPIVGATNANYTPVSTDTYHTLVAEVIATNGDGSVQAASVASGMVLSAPSSWTETVDSGYSLSDVSCIPSTTDCELSDSSGKALYTTNASTTGASSWSSWSGPSGQAPAQAIDCPSSSLCLLADGKNVFGGNLYYATSFGGAWNLAYSLTGYGVVSIACASSSFCITGQNYAQFHYSTNPGSTSWTSESQGSAMMRGAFCLSTSFCALADQKGNVHIATSTSQIESSSWKETDVDGTTALGSIACTSTTACVAGDDEGNVLNLTIESNGAATAVKHDLDGTKGIAGVACTTSATCVTVDTAGEIFLSKSGGEWTKLASFGVDFTSVSCSSSTLCLAADTSGEILSFNPSGEVAEGGVVSPQPGSTIEYGVPLSGSGAPQEMGSKEVEKWAQKDDPAYATAIFAPDEAQGWPASDYRRATVYYIDGEARTVNVASPSGAISTTEYNGQNDVTRTLSADDRAAAIKEGSKSAETAERLDTKTEYESEGNIAKVIGPEHVVKLATGEEVEARSVTHDYYNEGAAAVEAKTHEEYDLLTKTTTGALLAGGQEKDVRTTLTSYSGEGTRGWELRKPTSTTVDPHGLDLVHKTIYNAQGDVVETRSPGGNSEAVYPPSFASQFGSEGTGSEQFRKPLGVALDASGDEWVVDSENNRIEEWSAAGTLLHDYGESGSGARQFNNPCGIAINQNTGNVYVADEANNRIEELSSSGAYVASLGTSGSGTLSAPAGIAIDSEGNLWITDKGHDRIVELSAAGTFIREVGKEGSGEGQLKGPVGVAISEGTIFVADTGNDRIEQFSSTGAYVGQFGAKGTGAGQFNEPYFIAANPSTGNLYVADFWNERVQEFSPAGRYLTEWHTSGPTHSAPNPTGIAVASSGKLYIADYWGAKVTAWTPPETGAARLSYASQFGSSGKGEGQFSYPVGVAIDGGGYLWVSDFNNDRIEKFSPTGAFVAAYGKEGSGELQFSYPAGLDVNQSTGNVYVADAGNDRIEEISSSGHFVAAFGSSHLTTPGAVKIDSAGNVWVADFHGNRIVEFSSTGTFIASYGKEGTGPVEFKEPAGIAIAGEHVYVADSGNQRVQELSMAGSFIRSWGIPGEGSSELYADEAIATDAAGNVYVADNNANHIEEFTATGGYLATFGSKGSGEGQLESPTGVAIDAAGDMYVADSGNDRVEKWSAQNPAVHYAQTFYYTAKGESEIEACQNRPAWAGLPCRTKPKATQPNAPGAPPLPEKSFTYNIWDQVESTTEKFGSTTRTKTNSFDAAGRVRSSEVTSSNGTPLPKVTNEYNAQTGMLEKQSATIAGETKTLTTKTNTVGQQVEYTDAEGNVAKYRYEEGADQRLLELSEGKGTEADSSQAYSYNTTTGFLEKLVDSAAGTFTAAYDPEGKMTSEVYPNGMCANTTYNSLGTAVALEYIKTRTCSEKSAAVWFSDSIVPSIHGEPLQQTSTLSKESYGYDAAGRLLETQETPAGQGCTVRLYGYDEESDRTSLTTRAPGSEGKCAVEGGTLEHHTYDEADRLIDPGVEYEAFGDITSLPAADAGGHELKSTYYVNSQVAVQEQNGSTLKYTYDPDGRTLQTVSEGAKSAKVTSHYAGPGEALTWTSEGSGKWTRNIPGVDGALDAIQTSGSSPVLQIHDLKGDIVGTAALSEAETKLLSTYNSNEFGVPTTSSPPKYSWLGASGVASELTSGAIAEDGITYVPQMGRALQNEPVEVELHNTINPYVRENTGGGEWGPIAGALRIAEYWAAQRAAGEGEGAAAGGADPKCKVRGAIGSTTSSTGKEWVYARAWGSCSGATLPRYSEVEACLVIQPDELEVTGPFFYCSTTGAGFKPPGSDSAEEGSGTSLYAHQHEVCEQGITYKAWVWFWVPGLEEGIEKYTRGWQCNGSVLETVGEIGVVFSEATPPILP